MSDMVERVAKAIGVPEAGDFLCPWSLEAARRAIEAMRDPTDAMCVVGAKHYDDNYRPGHEREDTNAVMFWQDMINAALGKVDA